MSASVFRNFLFLFVLIMERKPIVSYNSIGKGLLKMLSERLKKLRKETGLSQYEVAHRLSFSRGKLANYEQGSREPDYETLQRIADFYDCSTDYLLGRSELRRQEITEDEKNLLQDVEDDIKLEELQKKYNLTIDGKVASKEEIEGAIAFIRSIRGMK